MELPFAYTNARQRIRMLGDLLEQWPAEAANVTAWDWQDVVAEQLSLEQVLQTLTARFAQRRAEGISNQLIVRALQLHDLLTTLHDNGVTLTKLAPRTAPEHQEALAASTQRLQATLRQHHTTWMLPTKATVEQSLQQAREGQFRVL